MEKDKVILVLQGTLNEQKLEHKSKEAEKRIENLTHEKVDFKRLIAEDDGCNLYKKQKFTIFHNIFLTTTCQSEHYVI